MFRCDPTHSPPTSFPGASFSSTDGIDDDVSANNAMNGPAPIAVYLYAGDQIVENVTTGYLYFQDSLGNTSHVTDAAGNLLERYTYTAFGTPTFLSANNTQLSTSAYGIRHLFQGQLWTQETALNDYRNRVELPTMGVFLQPDPIGFKGDAANLYRFCGNDAVNRTDPLGLLDRNWDAVRQAMDNCNLLGFFQGEARERMEAARIPTAQDYSASGFRSGAADSQASTHSARSWLPPWLAPVRVTGSSFAERQRFRHELQRALATPRGRELVALIKQQGMQRVIHLRDNWNDARSDTPGRSINIDPHFHPLINTTEGVIAASTARIIGHELGHAVTGAGWNENRGRAMDNVRQNENPIANALGEPSRISY
jgi:RHS repeat-associated protein